MDTNPKMLLGMVACCVAPMALIVVLTTVVGVTLGWAAALTVGLVVAGLCVAVMVQHHRPSSTTEAQEADATV